MITTGKHVQVKIQRHTSKNDYHRVAHWGMEFGIFLEWTRDADGDPAALVQLWDDSVSVVCYKNIWDADKLEAEEWIRSPDRQKQETPK